MPPEATANFFCPPSKRFLDSVAALATPLLSVAPAFAAVKRPPLFDEADALNWNEGFAVAVAVVWAVELRAPTSLN